ncbi:BPI fold-containing family B member 6 [Pelobates cultripes]|uniref:BPI fold-containing family B member 6 n=1 Tax=Pelobates cultripes TaxID=61616 RepID=A0AAD1SNU4_PELCU|nr:BPI fold-containing family B member 6 [Pelobates cultripes]
MRTMSWLWLLVVFSSLLVSSESLDDVAILQLDSCALQNVVTDILTNKEILDAMAKSPAAKKALGKKGSSPIKGISNIKVEDLKFSQISLNIIPGTGIRMSVTNKIFITGKSFLGGKTEMKLEVNIVTYTSLEKDNSSCPRFVRSECQINIIDVKANLPKGILPNVMNNFLDKNLKLLLPKTLCPAVDLVLSIVNEKMCTKNISFPFGKVGSLLYSVSLLPTVTEEHIEIEFNATVKQGDVLIQPSKNATEIFDLPSNPGETSFFLKDDFLSCAFTALQQEGVFNLIATESELADAATMSISALSDVIPEKRLHLTTVRRLPQQTPQPGCPCAHPTLKFSHEEM